MCPSKQNVWIFGPFEVSDLTWDYQLCKTHKTEYHSLSLIMSNMPAFVLQLQWHVQQSSPST